MMHIVCYLRQGSKFFETYWTTRRGFEAMGNSYRLLDLTVYGRQETWEDSPTGWPQRFKGKQHLRLKAGYLDDWDRQALNRAYHFLDLPPRRRDEVGFDFSMAWLRRHDRY